MVNGSMVLLQDMCSGDEVQQLRFDLDGFERREQTYKNFPEALLHWRVALEVVRPLEVNSL